MASSAMTITCLSLDDALFEFELDVEFILDGGLDEVDEVEDVPGGGVAVVVDDEAGVFGGDLGAADGFAFEVELFEDLADVAAGRGV